MMLNRVRCKVETLLRVFAIALAGLACMAWAAPDDEFREGSKAYSSGDVVQAMALLRKPADAGHAASQSLLAYILDKSGFNDEALAYYRKAAAQGNADGEFALGSKYASGEGIKRDHAQARKWITSAAEKGHVSATSVLATAYVKGDLGVGEGERGGAEALRWVRRAADTGDVAAMTELAGAYRTGAYGLSVDQKQAEALEAKVRKARGAPAKSAASKQSAAGRQERR